MRIFTICFLLITSLAQAVEAPASDPYAKIHSIYLKNGLKVILAPSPQSKTTQIKVVVDGGIFNELPGRSGVAHLLEHYLFTDAKLEKNMTYLEAIKEKGGSGNAMTTQKNTVYYATIPPPLVAWTLDIFGKILLEKDFDEARVQRAKGPVFLEIGQPNIFDYLVQGVQNVWPDFARPPDFWQSEFGIEEPMTKISAARLQTAGLRSEDLKSFYEREYYPANMTVYLAGQFDEASAIPLITRRFGAEPARAGFGWVDPTPHAKRGNFYRSEVSSGVPSIELGTKAADISLEDEIAARVYLEYLSFRLMKELRNLRGETYTVRPEIELKKRNGIFSIHFEAPEKGYRQNLKLAKDMIDRETRKGQFTPSQFKEAYDLYAKSFERLDGDSATMMRMADRLNYVEKDYVGHTAHTDDYLAFSDMTYPDFMLRLKTIFAPDMKTEELSEPPLFFRFELWVLVVFTFGFWMRLSRYFFAKAFAHNRIRWVRKISYPPAYLLQLAAFVVVLLMCALTYGTMYMVWVKLGIIQTPYLISDYLFSLLSVCLALVVAQCVFALFARKVMVVGDQLWLKSLGYRSVTVNLSQIESVELRSPLQVLFSFRDLLQIKYRFQYYDPLLWRKGLLIRLKDGRAYFLGVRAAREALAELQGLIAT
jgi:predicted Zn-dependent peptidase